MATRIVVFPVMGRRWAFTSVLPTGGSQSGSGSSSQGGSVRDLLQSLRASPRASEKVDLLTTYVSDKMNRQFFAWEAAPEGSLRKRLHHIGHRMLSRLGPTEGFLKAIPKDAEVVEIVYPKCGEVIHCRYLYGSIALLPFSAILGLLPLPNVVLAWNLFRAYSHWRALQGSRRLHYLVTDSPNETPPTRPQNETDLERDVSVSSDTQLFDEKRKADQSNHWVFLPSEILDMLLVQAYVTREAISDVTVSEICKEYPLDPDEIAKWRDQRLPIKSFG